MGTRACSSNTAYQQVEDALPSVFPLFCFYLLCWLVVVYDARNGVFTGVFTHQRVACEEAGLVVYSRAVKNH